MWRLVLVTSMLLTLAFGAIAEASPPPIAVESIVIDTDAASTTLRFAARTMDGSAFPETGTAVVMQFNGNQGKCLNVSLVHTGTSGDVGAYVGRLNFIYQGATVLSGRADIGGSIYDFSAPLDGTPGTVTLSSYQGSISGAGAPPIAAAQPVVITPDPATRDPRLAATAAPVVEPAPQARPAATAGAFDGLVLQPVAWLGLVVIIVAVVSAYFDRKRSLARATAG